MINYLLAIVSLTFLTVSTPQKYQPFTYLANQGIMNLIDFSRDQTRFILYKSCWKFKSPQYQLYQNYHFQLLLEQSLAVKICSSSFFTDKDNHNAFVYGNEAGQIRLKTLLPNKASFDMRIAKICDNIVQQIEVSKDNSAFAALCLNQTKFYIGDPQVGEQKLTEVQTNTTIFTFNWHPNSDYIAIGGQRLSQNQSNLFLYSTLGKKIIRNLDLFTSGPVFGVSFSQDGKKLAFIQKSQKNIQQYVTIINLQTNQTTKLIADGASQLIDLQTRGNFIASNDLKTVYVWQFDSSNKGSYPSSMHTLGLSITGSDLFTLDSINNTITVNRICPNFSQTYNDASNQCQSCQLPCQSCFNKPNKCLSCFQTFYWKQSQLICLPCIDNCRFCDNGTTCQLCQSQYYYQNNSCLLCKNAIAGCQWCNKASKCLRCDSDAFWQSKGNQCECMLKYGRVADQCKPCQASGCLNCSANANQCILCDQTQHRQFAPQDGECICSRGYFPQNDICSACLQGCVTCKNSSKCQGCDTNQNWQLNEGNCTCNSISTLILIQNTKYCVLCSKLMQGCLQCISMSNCTKCQQNFEWNQVTRLCQHTNNGSELIIILSIVGGAALIAGIVIAIVIFRRRKMSKVQTLLESQALEQQDRYQKLG